MYTPHQNTQFAHKMKSIGNIHENRDNKGESEAGAEIEISKECSPYPGGMKQPMSHEKPQVLDEKVDTHAPEQFVPR